MSRLYEELDYQQTELGELVLRRRQVLSLDGADVWEVKLNGSFLMSSMVNQAEIALAGLGLARLGLDRPAGADWRVLVGGLGLGHTAHAALADARVAEVAVVELLQPVIDWHRRGLVPLGAELVADPRCSLQHGDFFALFDAPPAGESPAAESDAQWDAILLDVDHSPEHLLQQAHGRFYSADGLQRLAATLRPGGVFGLWSAEAPGDAFVAALGSAFACVHTEVVEFENPLLDHQDRNYVVIAQGCP